MIRLIDNGNKGYVTMEEFLQFYLENQIVNEDVQELPEKFVHREAWRNAID